MQKEIKKYLVNNESTEKTGVACWEDILLYANKKRRSYGEVVKQYGPRTVMYAMLFEQLAALDNIGRPLSTPMRIFISYRWGTKQENNWVSEFSSMLKQRGYTTYLDKQMAQEDHVTDVFSIVAKMALSNMVIFIIDPNYIDRIGKERDCQLVDGVKFHPYHEKGWAYNEWILAKSLSNIIKIPFLGLLRKGNELPRGMKIFSENGEGNTFDVREKINLDRALDRLFPSLKIAISNDDIREAERLFSKSELLSQDNNIEQAIECISKGIQIAPFASNGYERMSVLKMRKLEYSEAYAYALNAINISPIPAHTNYLIAQAAATVKKYNLAIEVAQSYLESNNPNWQMELILFQTFCGIDKMESANVALERACRVRPNLVELFEQVIKKIMLLNPNNNHQKIIDVDVLPLVNKDNYYYIKTYEQVGKELFWATIRLPIKNIPGSTGMNEIDRTILSLSAIVYDKNSSNLRSPKPTQIATEEKPTPFLIIDSLSE